MSLSKIDNFWGLFEEPDSAGAETAQQQCRFEETERIGELQGEFGQVGTRR